MFKKSLIIIFPVLIITIYLIFSHEKKTVIKENPTIVEKWADIFQPSVMKYNERVKELQWFVDISKDFKGMTIKSTAEHIETHYWESRFLTRAFFELTGIKVNHQIIGEGEIVVNIMKQIEENKKLYDIYVNDADMVGTHLRTKGVVNLTKYMKGEGRKYTNPYLELNDFLNLEFGQDYNGDQLQLPDQQFANLYWFRYDWFSRDDIKDKFRNKYGYELGVPVNWAAYEDIAEFFTNIRIDGKKVYGHLDYGKPSPSLGWRFTDAWFSIAGVGDKGLPNGMPVDEWGIRVKNKIPVGSSVERGGAVNGPAALYALEKYIVWLKKYAPPEALNLEWHEAGPLCARGDIAQRIFQYVTWLSDSRFHIPDSPVCDKNGDPLWRVAPTPHGKYWDPGMKIGYQDAGSWTIPINIKGKRRAAAWLWAQFCVSRTVSLKKFIVGGTPVRKSTIFSKYLTGNMEHYGGLIEFYRSSVEKKWTDSGRNVPYYSEMSKLWWKNIARAISGKVSPQKALDDLAEQQDNIMSRKKMNAYSPVLNKKRDRSYWLSRPGAPKKRRMKEKPRTVPYKELLSQWKKNMK